MEEFKVTYFDKDGNVIRTETSSALLEAKKLGLLALKTEPDISRLEITHLEGVMIFSKDKKVEDGTPTEPTVPNKEQERIGLAGLFTTALAEEWQTIDKYNSIISTLIEENAQEELIESIQYIITDCTIHVGILQRALTIVSPELVDTELKVEEPLPDAEVPEEQLKAEDDGKPHLLSKEFLDSLNLEENPDANIEKEE